MNFFSEEKRKSCSWINHYNCYSKWRKKKKNLARQLPKKKNYIQNEGKKKIVQLINHYNNELLFQNEEKKKIDAAELIVAIKNFSFKMKKKKKIVQLIHC
jgi:hypothetical protein